MGDPADLCAALGFDADCDLRVAVQLLGGGCGNGEVEAGEECDDGNNRNGDGCDASCAVSFLSFQGVRRDVDPAEVAAGGFEVCHQDLYNAHIDDPAAIAACDGDVLMLACRQVGQANYRVAAMGLRAEVIRDVGNGNQAVNNHNGVGFYYAPDHSWGFVAEGNAISRNSCDTVAGEDKLCWHTSAHGGYRCGAQAGLNSNAGWERFVLHRPGGL